MPRYAIICIDKPDSLELRLVNRPAHLVYVAEHADQVKMAGPFLDDQGRMAGSLLIVEAPDFAAIQAFAAADPYTLAGLFERVDIRQVGGNFDKL